MKLHRCAVCGKLSVCTPILMNGKNGYRRYQVCATCARLGGKIVPK
jgi:hypothetical protein